MTVFAIPAGDRLSVQKPEKTRPAEIGVFFLYRPERLVIRPH
jgi:hypothetical protein